MKNWQHRITLKKIGVYFVAFIALFLTLFPVFWIFTISIKTKKDAFAMPPVWDFQPIWDNYVNLLHNSNYMSSFQNSTIITIISVGFAILVGIPAAYALNRLKLKGKNAISLLLLLSYMFPEFLFSIPMYVLYQKLGLYDTQIALALTYQCVTLPFSIWLLRGFFQSVPKDLEDAALIDGCTRFSTLWRIYLPISAPGIAATAVLSAMWVWNELNIALSLTYANAQTITVAMAGFRGYASIDWGGMAAGSIAAIVPMLIFAIFAQKYIVEGLTLGAVK
ncbi:MAG: carbohydrate ABC transporter permease [Anaerolineaceae bacterium]|jgi:multiple sugar transport system permease protein|nr:carbohydrate ABC transporter permease [bacterium]